MERKTALVILAKFGDEILVDDLGRKERGLPYKSILVRRLNGGFAIPGADGKEYDIDPVSVLEFYQARETRKNLTEGSF